MSEPESSAVLRLTQDNMIVLEHLAEVAETTPELYVASGLALGCFFGEVVLSAQPGGRDPVVLFEREDGNYEGHKINFSSIPSRVRDRIVEDLNEIDMGIVPDIAEITVNERLFGDALFTAEMLNSDMASFVSHSLRYLGSWLRTRRSGGQILVDDTHVQGQQRYRVVEDFPKSDDS